MSHLQQRLQTQKGAQRRAVQRVPLPYLSWSALVRSDSRRATGVCLDVSTQGMRLLASTPLRPGETVEIEIQPRGSPAQHVRAVVVRCQENDCEIGLRFIKADSALVDKISAMTDLPGEGIG